MANWQLNRLVKGRQYRTLTLVGVSLVFIIALAVFLLSDESLKKKESSTLDMDLTGIVNESFTAANADSALTAQQAELESLKTQITTLVKTVNSMNEAQEKALKAQKEEMQKELLALNKEGLEKNAGSENASQSKGVPPELASVENQTLWHTNTYAMNGRPHGQSLTLNDGIPAIHTVSFRKKHVPHHERGMSHYLNPARYVPSNTSVRAVILGGADADASVNGQSKNNGVMLFKFLEDGTLPNGQRSRLRGCRVSANSYGDISSERAFATLYRLSCAHKGQPIIDKEVTGWVFFNGKVGIKGQPLMRDNKVMQWAGVSGALSGIASAAQYAQSVQQIGAFGASSVVPSSNIAPFAAYGGASKAADTLSQYYVKRAEQYHPVIQVGSGNVVTVVFKDGFYLEPDEEHMHHSDNQGPMNQGRVMNHAEGFIAPQEADESEAMNFNVPPEVLGRIDSASRQSRPYEGASQ